MSEKDNEFDQIINEFPSIITEEDLKKLLDIKLSLFSNQYIWLLSGFFSILFFVAGYKFSAIKDFTVFILTFEVMITGVAGIFLH